jgi:hypothetical protein
MGRMENLRRAAFVSIGRAVAFAGLGIFVVMVGLSFDPVLALRTGGVLLLILLAGLLLRAQQVQRADYRHTEAWLLLDRTERPSDRTAGQQLIAALREACMLFARWTAGAAALVWGFAVLSTLVTFGSRSAM